MNSDLKQLIIDNKIAVYDFGLDELTVYNDQFIKRQLLRVKYVFNNKIKIRVNKNV